MTDRKRHPARAGEMFFGVVLRMAYLRFREKWFNYERPEDEDLNGSLGELFLILALNLIFGVCLLGIVLVR